MQLRLFIHRLGIIYVRSSMHMERIKEETKMHTVRKIPQTRRRWTIILHYDIALPKRGNLVEKLPRKESQLKAGWWSHYHLSAWWSQLSIRSVNKYRDG